MKPICAIVALFVCMSTVSTLLSPPLYAQASTAPILRGTVTDPSGAAIPDAVVIVRGGGRSQQARTDAAGQYTVSGLRAGKQAVRIIAPGFAPFETRDFDLAGSSVLDAQLNIASEAQVLTVQEEINEVTTDPTANASAIVLREKELEALSDDPDELAQQLQALAGPSGGPNGGQIYIDGFTGGNLPPKASIREVRINSNPFSSEYDRPGFGRIEILTKPGADRLRGQAFFQFNNQSLNSRSPLLAQPSLPPYDQKFFGFSLGGPIKKQKASFGFDFERRNINENAFILATTLDPSFSLLPVNSAIVTPQTRTNFTPRIDYAINATNTLVARYQNTRMSRENEGIGDYSLQTRGYDQRQTEHTLQLTETAVLSPKMINETRFQMQRSNVSRLGDNSIPAINVQGAFNGGGAQVGQSGTQGTSLELTNATTYTMGRHTIKWGGRLRQSFLTDTSMNNFGGTFSFLGGAGPVLDANNQPVAGASEQLLAIERYRRTLLFQSMGYSAAQVRALGGGATFFSIGAGTPATSINQFDVGLFVNDDWRVRPNLTLSYGLRYETQTNISDLSNLSPRFGLAWGIDGGANKPAKTVLRAGFGVFYNRIDDSLSLQTLRFNGVTQQSFLLQQPNFFPVIPDISTLTEGQQPQQLQFIDQNILAPRTYQTSIGLDRQINRYAKIGVQYIATRGVHLQRTRSINAPINGVYPFGDQQLRFLTESTGFSRTSQLTLSPSVNYKRLFLFGFYSYGHGKTDAEGQPADPYNLRAEWGPSSFADVRHRAVIGTSVPLPWKISLSPFIMMSSGSPYNITIGRDINGDTLANERPALLSGVGAAGCSGGSLYFASEFGCFDLSGASGSAITRNYGRGPSTFNMNMRLSRSWAFGARGESGMGNTDGGGPRGGPDGGGPRGGGGGGMRGGGGMGGGMRGGGPPPGMFGGASGGKKYGLNLSLSARNILNNANYAPPGGDLSSPFFGAYRSLAGFGPFGGNSTYNRKIDVQLRFTF